jgi:hypothetical protein
VISTRARARASHAATAAAASATTAVPYAASPATTATHGEGDAKIGMTKRQMQLGQEWRNGQSQD